MKSDLTLPAGYAELLTEIKERVRAAQVRAGLAANRELLALYWDIGRMILARQEAEGWGAKVIDRLSRDLHAVFPGQHGFSPRNLKYMRAFADAWPDPQFVQQPAAQIPWTHHCMLLDKVQTPADRLWYAAKAIENGWSRNILALQIQSALHTRQGRAVSNFPATLPPPQSDLAQQITKDPYLFDFLNLRDDANERAVESGLLGHVERFLLELGAGFALVGRQVHLEVGEQDFYLDLLFYHLTLRCFVVIDLKARDFTPEAAGKMNSPLLSLGRRRPVSTGRRCALDRSDPLPRQESDSGRVCPAGPAEAHRGSGLRDPPGRDPAGAASSRRPQRQGDRGGAVGRRAGCRPEWR